MADVNNIPFGAADITIGTGVDAVAFDGKNFFQADGGSVSLEPVLSNITFIDFGEGDYDDRVNGWNGAVTVVGSQNDIKLLKLALSAADVVVDGTTSKETITDSRIGTSLRDKGQPVVIHPREMGDDHSLDIHIYNVTAANAFEREFNAEQGSFEIELKMYPKKGADASLRGNYFFIGDTDPNPVVPA
jgi:hypothetical protein